MLRPPAPQQYRRRLEEDLSPGRTAGKDAEDERSLKPPEKEKARTTYTLFVGVAFIFFFCYLQASQVKFGKKFSNKTAEYNYSDHIMNNNKSTSSLVQTSFQALAAVDHQQFEELAKRVQILEQDLKEERERNEEREAAPPPVIPIATELPQSTSKINDNDNDSPPRLPKCADIMSSKSSPYRDGQFLTRLTIPVTWYPRVDDSRELRHPMCQLHRYTPEEARTCLAGKHLMSIGDSLSRYHFLSLATFLHKGQYPPRFGKSTTNNGECQHIDEHGNKACSPPDEPSMCMEGEWRGGIMDPWVRYNLAIGGDRFNGYVENVSVRKNGMEGSIENFYYASPVSESSPKDQQFVLSFTGENGWGNDPTPIRGFQFTGCAFHGNCSYTEEQMEINMQMHVNGSYHFSEPFVDSMGPNGALRKYFPPVDIVQYNRGLWGVLDNKEKVKNITKAMYGFSGGQNGRCLFRSTTGRFSQTREAESHLVKESTLKAGCGFFDLAHLLEDFNDLLMLHPPPPPSTFGSVIHEERSTIYWDAVHFQPWVYEETNNMLLNVLCNAGLNKSSS